MIGPRSVCQTVDVDVPNSEQDQNSVKITQTGEHYTKVTQIIFPPPPPCAEEIEFKLRNHQPISQHCMKYAKITQIIPNSSPCTEEI